jgi:hypothetical protein
MVMVTVNKEVRAWVTETDEIEVRLAEETYPHRSGRSNSLWTPLHAGSIEGAIDAIFRNAAKCVTGDLKGPRNAISTVTYIDSWMRKMRETVATDGVEVRSLLPPKPKRAQLVKEFEDFKTPNFLGLGLRKGRLQEVSDGEFHFVGFRQKVLSNFVETLPQTRWMEHYPAAIPRMERALNEAPQLPLDARVTFRYTRRGAYQEWVYEELRKTLGLPESFAEGEALNFQLRDLSEHQRNEALNCLDWIGLHNSGSITVVLPETSRPGFYLGVMKSLPAHENLSW